MMGALNKAEPKPGNNEVLNIEPGKLNEHILKLECFFSNSVKAALCHLQKFNH